MAMWFFLFSLRKGQFEGLLSQVNAGGVYLS